ncbi:ABC transporter permease [Paenibacillus soyae]|uniref:ABC transporter permease n=1 Tax=Paenibacillus soyae TaxID=2969249 RepID=A0A9X2SCF0_9BACL|nr:ABC transporter permease [Paenibacillus soyae]MCR2807920.1 ABC transporter permease [Paenibacillus soyae]
MILFIKLLRDIRQSIGQLTAFVLVIAVGAFFYAGLTTYSDNLSAYAENYFIEHRLSDVNVAFNSISPKEAAGFSELEGVHKAEGRYTVDAAQTFENARAALKIHSIPRDNEINTLTLIEGKAPSNKDEILLDSHYAAEHRYQLGDQIEISANDRLVTFTVSGLGENVEHAKKNDTQDHINHGFAYIAEDAIPLIADEFTYNELLIDAEEGYDIDRLSQSVEAYSKQNKLQYAGQTTKERSFSYSKINETIYNNKLMSRVIPLVLFLIEAIILFLAMSRIMDSQRNQVGIMKALGVKNRSIMLHYMGYPVLVSVIGSILGCILAGMVFVPMVTESSARSYSLPGITFSLSAFSAIPPILFSSAFGVLACYFSGRSLLKERAAQAMRQKPPKTMTGLFMERTPGIWHSVSYSHKLILRNMLLNRSKAIASSIGVVVSTVLLITALGTQSSLMKVAGQMDDVFTYDLKVDYAANVSAESVRLPSGIRNGYWLSAMPAELIIGDVEEAATFVVTEKENSLIHFYDEHGEKLLLEETGVLVPQSYADAYDIRKGDMIKIKLAAPEMSDKIAGMKVLDISAQYSNPSFYTTPTYLESFDIDFSPASLVIQAESADELERIRGFFEQDRQVEAISDREDLRKSAEYILNQNSFVFILFIICAVILSFGAIYTISSINIYERNRELATLKVLGYPSNKINGLIFLENLILTAVAAAAAIPVSWYVFNLIVNALSSTHQQIPDQLSAIVVLAAILLSFALTMLSNLLLRRKVTRIHMIEALKSMD